LAGFFLKVSTPSSFIIWALDLNFPPRKVMIQVRCHARNVAVASLTISDRPRGLDYLTEEEEKQLQDISTRQEIIEIELAGYKNQEKLRTMVLGRAEKAAAYLELKSVKELCGYDNRLAVNQAQFAKWSKTEEGKRALDSGVLGPRTAETTSIGGHVLMPGQVAPDSTLPDEINNICTKKKCAKHSGWAAVHKDDISYSYSLLVQENKRLTNKRNQIIENAELTEAMKDEYSDNVTIQCF
jgi:COMPASS component SPP1